MAIAANGLLYNFLVNFLTILSDSDQQIKHNNDKYNIQMERKVYVRPIAEVVDIETESLMVPASMNKVESNAGFHYGNGGNVPNRTRSHSRNTWSNGWD